MIGSNKRPEFALDNDEITRITKQANKLVYNPRMNLKNPWTTLNKPLRLNKLHKNERIRGFDHKTISGLQPCK